MFRILFLVDDPDDLSSDPESISTPLALDAAELSKSQTTITPTEEVLLGLPTPASPQGNRISYPGLSKPVVAVPHTSPIPTRRDPMLPLSICRSCLAQYVPPNS